MPFLRLERHLETVEHDRPSPSRALVAVGRPHTAQAATGPDDRLAALGLRSLADLLAPSSMVIADDHLVLDGQYTRVLVLADLPPVVAAGWLNGLLAERLPVNLSLHLRRLDAGAAAKALKLKSWRLGGALSDDGLRQPTERKCPSGRQTPAVVSLVLAPPKAVSTRPKPRM